MYVVATFHFVTNGENGIVELFAGIAGGFGVKAIDSTPQCDSGLFEHLGEVSVNVSARFVWFEV